MTTQSTADFRGLLQALPSDPAVVDRLREAIGQGPGAVQSLADVIRELETQVDSGTAGPEERLRLGVARLAVGHFRDALQHLEQAGDWPVVAYLSGLACRNLGDLSAAARHFEKARAAGFRPMQMELELLDIRRQQEGPEEALAALEKLPAEAQTTGDYYYVRGACRADLGQHLEAAADFEKALELDPQHPGALFRAAWENDLHGNDDEAIQLYERCVSRPLAPIAALINLGVLYEDRGQWKAAERCYERVLTADPQHPRARLYLGDARASEHMFYDEEAERRHDRFAAILEVPVTDFELSVRSRNCLKKMNIRNLGDLIRTTEAQLLGSKNFGETSLREIKAMLQAKGLRLGQALEEPTTEVPVTAGPFRPGGPAAPAATPSSTPLGLESVLNKPVDEMQLSVRSRRCMERLNIKTVGDLINKTESQLLECKNFGQTSLNEVRRKLAELGLSLRR